MSGRGAIAAAKSPCRPWLAGQAPTSNARVDRASMFDEFLYRADASTDWCSSSDPIITSQV